MATGSTARGSGRRAAPTARTAPEPTSEAAPEPNAETAPETASEAAPEPNAETTGRDPDFVRRVVPAVARFVGYFSPEVRGLEHLPATGPVLLVGNHSCLFYMPDTWVVGLAITARRGPDAPAYALVYDLLMRIPGIGPALARIGAVPAGGEVAEKALAEGAAVLDYPGGDAEACRPWTERNRIEFAGHTGFVRLALRTGVPVVPVVSYGSHQAVTVLARGDRLASVLGLHRLRIKVFPILLGPFGITSILVPPLPQPSAITVEFLPPLDWSGLGPEAAADESIVDACYREITGAMQAALDRLHAERPHPVLCGWSRLLRGGLKPLELPSS
ncbi:MAG: 1-acyl-sn-glycerol-3-phosphate acyltransferase [Acidimicrobiales bacterium]